MNKLRALQDFEDQDGNFVKDEEFVVNDERAFVLIRTGKAERCTDQRVDDQPGVENQAAQFYVPRQQPE